MKFYNSLLLLPIAVAASTAPKQHRHAKGAKALNWGDDEDQESRISLPSFGDGDGLNWFDWDWDNFDPDNFDWGDFTEWGSGSWDDIFAGFSDTGVGLCTILESAVGMSQSFGIAGGCTCDGNLISGMNISCAFENQCVQNSDVCGSLSLTTELGDIAGDTSTSVCLDFENDDYLETCFSYNFDLGASDTQTCAASYGGNPCECEIDGFCLQIDCSRYLPGAKMDTCEHLQMTSETDVSRFLPTFEIFDPNFSGFEFGEIDWNDVDWENFDWLNFDFNMVEWGDAGWSDLFSEQTLDNIDICPVLETIAGMSEAFGIAADCSCKGNITSGMEIGCSFDACIPETDICGSVDLDFAFDDVGSIAVGACVDLGNDEYLETCFTYEIPMLDFTAQECTASYGGNPCGCEIDGFCLSVDCSAYLPGAKMDTCQFLEIADDAGLQSFFPNFEIFNPDFEFNVESIEWELMDWENIDWANFDFNLLSWDSAEWDEMSWADIFGIDVNEIAICPALEKIVSMSKEFGIAGDCSCEGGIRDEFAMYCAFEGICADDNRELCGDISVGFEFESLNAIKGNVCAEFVEGEHPETCFSYEIPFADPSTPSECSATYGGKECSCSIDENLCVKLDCSEHELTAVMDTCQTVSMDDASAIKFLPRFGIPKSSPDLEPITNDETSETPETPAVPDTEEIPITADIIKDEPIPESNGFTEANQLEDDSSASLYRLASTAVLSILSLSLVLYVN